MKLKSFFVMAVLFLTTFSLSAQTNPRSGKFGVGIDDISSSPNLLFKYYFTDNFAMNFIAGMNLDIQGDDAPAGQTKVDGYDLRFGLAGLYHFNLDRLSPYLGLEALFGVKQDAGFYTVEPDPKNNIKLGVILGADYFLFDQFSIGIKQNLNFDFALSRDIPVEETDLFINTTTQLTGRYYFN